MDEIGNLSHLGLEVHANKQRGRCLITTVSHQPGEIIFKSKPYSFVLHPRLWGRKCNFCFESRKGEDGLTEKSLLRCTGCSLHHYCSADCQRKDWNAGHKKQCKKLNDFVQSGTEEDAAVDVLLLGRTLWKMQSDQTHAEAEEKNGVTILTPSIQNVEEMVSFSLPEHESIVETTLELKFTPSNTSRDQVASLEGKFQCNNFGIMDSILNVVGAGVYPYGAMLNHSCTPNCVLLYDAITHEQVVRCIAPISEGEELCHTFLDVASPTTSRQLKLQQQYNFTCTCSRCEDGLHIENSSGETIDMDACMVSSIEGKKLSESSSDYQEMASRAQNLENLAKGEEDAKEEFDLLRATLELKEACLHPENIDLYSTRGQLLTASLIIGDVEVAIEQCKKLVEFLEKVYSHIPNSPMLGLQIYTLGNLYFNIKDFSNAIHCLERSKAICTILYGEDSEMVRGIQSLLQESITSSISFQMMGKNR